MIVVASFLTFTQKDIADSTTRLRTRLEVRRRVTPTIKYYSTVYVISETSESLKYPKGKLSGLVRLIQLPLTVAG